MILNFRLPGNCPVSLGAEAEAGRERRKAMAIVRWTDPIREFAQLQDRFNRAFSDAYGRSDDGLLTSGNWVPPVDIYQNDNQEVVLKAEVPDLTREDIDITLDNGTLTIKGEKKFGADVKDDQYHRVERRYGSFSRTFTLPRTVDATKVAAEYKNGVLTVRLPLREEAKPRQIKVDVAA
jgi:HSP20 family protein